MKNAGLKITADIMREDGSLAQQVVFDQRGLTYIQLLELQQKALLPVSQTLLEIMARWGQEAAKAEVGNAGSPSPISSPKT